MKVDTKLFNRYAKGRCPDKFRAMANLCRLTDKQYQILVDKWCSGKDYTVGQIAVMNALSERTFERYYLEAKEKILAKVEEYNQDGFSGRFFFALDMKLNGNDWSKYLETEIDKKEIESDAKITKWLYEDKEKKK